MSTTTEPTITHPEWCNLEVCSVDGDDGVHWSGDDR